MLRHTCAQTHAEMYAHIQIHTHTCLFSLHLFLHCLPHPESLACSHIGQELCLPTPVAPVWPEAAHGNAVWHRPNHTKCPGLGVVRGCREKGARSHISGISQSSVTLCSPLHPAMSPLPQVPSTWQSWVRATLYSHTELWATWVQLEGLVLLLSDLATC